MDILQKIICLLLLLTLGESGVQDVSNIFILEQEILENANVLL